MTPSPSELANLRARVQAEPDNQLAAELFAYLEAEHNRRREEFVQMLIVEQDRSREEAETIHDYCAPDLKLMEFEQVPCKSCRDRIASYQCPECFGTRTRLRIKLPPIKLPPIKLPPI